MDILKIDNISFAYEKNKNLENISFNVRKGEIFCILGPNGCGKSTLLDCILGVNRIQEGKITLNDINIKKYKDKEVAKYISYVPQSHTKSFPYTVKDIVIMGRTHSYGFVSQPSEEDKEDLIVALEKVGIEKLKDRVYTSLSGGELQLVLIARALFQNAKIIIMDEPTSHLDFYYENKVLKIISNLVKENNISVVMATHFLNHPLFFENNNVTTRVGMMNEKKMVYIDNPSQIITKEKLKEVYKINAYINEFKHENKTYRQVVTLS